MKHHISSQKRKDVVLAELIALPIDGSHSVEIKRLPKKRTIPQNSAMYVFFPMLAKALNDAGHEMVVRVMDGVEVEVPWTEVTIKNVLWYTIMFKMFGKESTADLTTTEVTEIYEALNRWTSSEKGVHVPWPRKRKK